MWNGIFEGLARRVVRDGTLNVTMPDGHRFTTGTGAPEFAIRLTDPALPRRIVMTPELALGEGYTEGGLVIEGDDLRGFMGLILRNLWAGHRPRMQLLDNWIRGHARRLGQWNPAPRARRNVAHHYDLSGELYDLFLDADKQYSCAYFRSDEDSLERAQEQKKAHIARKLRLRPGMRVLDIGCGWGGMALTLARDHGARVLGVTLSREQHAVATARAREAGLEDRVEFRLLDYRRVEERFDRIVSVGMFEHVGAPHYDEYFGKIHEILEPEGVALVHTIGRTGPPGVTSSWISKYIFPGGYIPALSEMSAAIERSELVSTDIEVWRLHYAKTLRHWEERFTARIDRARELYDERFCRMWRYYLVTSELAFVFGGQVVFQAQIAHRKDAVPITRDYLYPARPERARVVGAAPATEVAAAP
ncbi:cyclopropane-fatty-acyl-phospholipid synthase [Palleronia aestuarii]|uniref:Cyclopropane-fatty-acyl-phospholipid synthase n=1 Tax=Palleronia aestuarii TaxID=568105 RepID=A0A2W7NNB7_9RHOB|nr:cyclopropane-fatty-acyl-phospholipid synthase family protein [Palleronia aestuarii]PZX19607.1 cyclopropane-fatty-acyl-phospholipid synthase [Palleronia aestuarii]